MFRPCVVWTLVSLHAILSRCVLQNHGLHGVSVAVWHDVRFQLPTNVPCCSRAARHHVRVSVCVCWHLPEALLLGSSLHARSFDFSEDSVLGFSEKQVSLLLSHLVVAKHERGLQADREAVVWLFACPQAPSERCRASTRGSAAPSAAGGDWPDTPSGAEPLLNAVVVRQAASLTSLLETIAGLRMVSERPVQAV